MTLLPEVGKAHRPASLPMQHPTQQPTQVRELHYRVRTPARGHFPGAHRSQRGDSGFEFRAHANLFDAPDPRRLDLHASLRDPFGAWKVRIYSQRQAIAVVVVADLSASMDFDGAHRKRDVLAEFTASLAFSAWRSGDRFGFVGCDDAVREDLVLPPTRNRAAGADLAERLRTLDFRGHSARALTSASRYLGQQRALVFLVSDFHLPPTEISATIQAMALHDLVPVVLWDRLEFGLTATHGLLRANDPETGRETLVWWRPGVRKRWLAAREAQREALQQLFRAHRLRPLFIEGAFDADAVTRHFQL